MLEKKLRNRIVYFGIDCEVSGLGKAFREVERHSK